MLITEVLATIRIDLDQNHMSVPGVNSSDDKKAVLPISRASVRVEAVWYLQQPVWLLHRKLPGPDMWTVNNLSYFMGFLYLWLERAPNEVQCVPWHRMASVGIARRGWGWPRRYIRPLHVMCTKWKSSLGLPCVRSKWRCAGHARGTLVTERAPRVEAHIVSVDVVALQGTVAESKAFWP
jgi:hypothetical protein